MKNYYEALDVESSATEKEIKSAYRKLAREHHPDMGGEAKKFHEIHDAYSVLSDEKKEKKI